VHVPLSDHLAGPDTSPLEPTASKDEFLELKGQDVARLKGLAHLQLLELPCDDGNRTLVLSGELDMASAGLLDCPLLQISADGTTSFTLDLSGLTFIDSSGIRAVLAAMGLCAARDCEFRVVPGPAQVQRVFEVSGLSDHLPFTNHGAGEVAAA
jgi:anti-anti-sigma factor